MPRKMEMIAVASDCTEYDPQDMGEMSAHDEAQASCEKCSHWGGEEEKCELDLFDEQLVNLDQT